MLPHLLYPTVMGFPTLQGGAGSTVYTFLADGTFTPALAGYYRVEVVGPGGSNVGGGGAYNSGTLFLDQSPQSIVVDATQSNFAGDTISCFVAGDGPAGAGGTPGDNDGLDIIAFDGGPGGGGLGGSAGTSTGPGVDGGGTGQPGDGGNTGQSGFTGYIRITGPLVISRLLEDNTTRILEDGIVRILE